MSVSIHSYSYINEELLNIDLFLRSDVDLGISIGK